MEKSGKPDPVSEDDCRFCGDKNGHKNASCSTLNRWETLNRAGFASRKCTYELCGGELHETATCEMLHHRCSVCHFRGHFEPVRLRATSSDNNIIDLSPFCNGGNGELFSALRQAFERSADEGKYTRFREHLGGLGFYPEPDFPLPGYCVKDYKKLNELPVFIAAALASGKTKLSYSVKKN